jgi:protein-S-isoprenylcysteine O-methyltransferase Ste14
MIKDVFTLKKTSWHCKLMKWTWKFSPEDFTHLCPYFWLTIFNIILSPILFLLRTPILTLIEAYIKIEVRMEERWLREAHRYYYKANTTTKGKEAIITMCEKRWRKISDFLRVKDHDFWREMYNERAKRYDATLIVHNTTAKSNKERINSILKIVKPILRVLGYLLGILVVAGIGYCVYLLIIKLSRSKLPSLADILVTIGVIIGMALIIWLIALICSKISKSCSGEKAANIILWPFLKIYQASLFVIAMVKESCPAIKWEDK